FSASLVHASKEASSMGIQLINGEAKSLIVEQDKTKKKQRAVGVKLADGRELRAQWILVACGIIFQSVRLLLTCVKGAWTPVLLPQLRDVMVPVAQPVFHFQVHCKYCSSCC